MKAKLTKKLIAAVVAGVVLLSYCGYFITHNEEMHREKIITVSLESKNSETTEQIQLQNGISVCQTVDITSDGTLNQISIRVINVPKDPTGTMELIISSNDGEELYKRTIDGSTLLDGSYYFTSSYTLITITDININAVKGDRLAIEWVANDMDETPYFLICHRTGADSFKIDGKQQEDSLMVFSYQIVQPVSYLWVALLICLVLVGFIVSIVKKPRLFYIAVNILCIASPILILLCGSWINDTGDYLKTEYGLINLGILYIIYFVFQCVLGRKCGGIIFVVISSFIVLGNYYLYQFRGQPIEITDIAQIKTAASVAGNYSFAVDFYTISFVIISFELFFCVICSDLSWLQKKLKLCNSKMYIIRTVVSCLGIISLIIICKATTLDINSWDKGSSYRKYGWLYTNIKIIKSCGNLTPAGYTSEEAKSFIEQAGNIQLEEQYAVKPQNLIVIMDEAFSDLSVLGDFETDTEVIPFFDSLENSEYIEKGRLNVHVLGGGTATTEWEFLTEGNSKFLDTGSLSPYNFIESNPEKYNTINLCSESKLAGYRTVAIHPYNADGYGRDKIYPLFRFDDFINTDNDFQDAEYIRWCISDNADVDRVIQEYENKDSDLLFIFNITMQNHGSYSFPMDEVTVHVNGISSDEVDSYLSLINYTDKALEKLIEYFSYVKEPTMIVFFGDHQPSLPDEFYSMVFETTEPTKEQEETKYITPYLIWSNYPRTTYDKTYINVGYLSAIVKSEARLEQNHWDKYLLSAMNGYPVIGNYGYYDSNYSFIEYEEKSIEEDDILQQMKYAQYYWWTNKDNID